MQPGQKDVKSINLDGKKCNVRKRLLLGNLKEIFKKFKKENPTVEIGLTKFCSLRPDYCVLAGSGGTHRVCVCPIHENMILQAAGKLEN